jgi:hypothetical protein
MKVDPAVKDLSFTSQTTCPEVTVSGTQSTDGFLINIAYPKKNGVNFPSSCVSVTVSVPPAYVFDPAFKLNADLMAVSTTIDLGSLAIGNLALNSMSGSVQAANMKVSNQINVSTMSGGIKMSKVDGTFSKAKISAMSGKIDLSGLGSSTASAIFDIDAMSGTISADLVSFNTRIIYQLLIDF